MTYRKTLPSPEETAFVVTGLNLALVSNVGPFVNSFIVPVMRDLLDIYPLRSSRLPKLPNTQE